MIFLLISLEVCYYLAIFVVDKNADIRRNIERYGNKT